MICYALLTVLFRLLCVEAAGEGDSYTYHFRRLEFVDQEILRRMVPAVEWKVESVCRMMEVNCRFLRAVEEYEQLQKVAGSCVTSQDRKDLQDAKSGFKTSREECIKSADCTSKLSEGVAKSVTLLQNIDTLGYKQVEACGSDESCKYKAYNDTNTNIFNLYVKSRPRLRLLADQGVASDNCAGAIVTCMLARNQATLRNVYKGVAKLRECQETGPARGYNTRPQNMKIVSNHQSWDMYQHKSLPAPLIDPDYEY